MHRSALEEAALTEHTNEQKPQPEASETAYSPEPEAAQPEPQKPETTALVPTEPEVIEGEVIEIEPPEVSEDHTPPKQKPYWLLIPLTIFLCLVFLAGSLLLPVLTPPATITLIPVEKSVSTTTTIQVQGRQLAPLTLMQSMSVEATGKRHQDATRAEGTITFYNGLLSSQTIAAGTILTGKDGVHVITDQAAIIPAGNPPIYGQVTVSAHAVLAGTQGNIQTFNINAACCATSVVAKNTQDFTGGQNSRDFLTVTRGDINHAVTSLLITLSRSEDAALQVQLHPGEELITPSCTPTVLSNKKIGDEAKQVIVTVSVTCGGITYVAHKVYALATQLLTSQAEKTLGATYALIGNMQVGIVQAKVIHPRQGIIMNKQQALATLLKFPGIAGANITMKGGNQTLPEDPNNIHMIVMYRNS